MLVLLTVLFACDRRCPTFDELKVRLSDDGESPTIAERAELAISNFRSWTTLDGVCVDDLRVGINQTEWEHPAWLNDGRDEVRIYHDNAAYSATLHGLCHAADEALGGPSETRPDLFDSPIPGWPLSRAERIQENFASYCAQGPYGDIGDDVDAACTPTFEFTKKRFLLETVYDAVEDADTLPLLPFVLGERVSVKLTEDLRLPEEKLTGRGVMITARRGDRWVAQTYSPVTGDLVHELVLEEFDQDGENYPWWEIGLTTGERTVLVRSWVPEPYDVDNQQDSSAWELGAEGLLTPLGASEHTAAGVTVGIVEPRGVWDGSEDSVLVDLNTNETLGTASSLLGVRGWVYGAVGAHLRVQTKGGDHVVVGQDGVVHLTVPAHLDWGGHNNRTSAYSEGRLLHTDRADDGALVLLGMDGDGVISTLASGCGETPIAIRDVVTSTFDGVPYLLVKHTTGDLLGYTELSVYPILPMP